MTFTAVFAGIHVADLDAARAWYERLAGRPADLIPNEDEAAWQFTETGWIYLVRDARRAGTAAVTLLLDDLDERLAELERREIAHDGVETYANGVRKLVISDPEGNTVAFGEVPAGA
jgi:catechol 2,3-dioxygenase-like lactoylglutathione lyase family enzyme